MYGLSDPDALGGVGHVSVRQVLDVDVAGQTVVQPDADTCRLTWTCACVEVVPYLVSNRTLYEINL